MTVEELTVRSSVQIYQADKNIMKPEGFGTGCIVRYLDHTLLLSVSHVTNDDGLTTFLETNLPPDGRTTPLKPIGGLVYYDVFNVTEGMDLTDFVNLIEDKAERIDITFAKITEKFELKQPATDFGYFQVEASDKLILNLDDAAVPDKDRTYSFYGKVRPDYQGIYLKMTPTLKNGLKFHRTNGYFHMFLAPEVIKHKDDYRGCSGAPILDSEGQIVALACKIVENTKVVYGFSIQECMKLIKMTIDTNQL
ncbi:MAG: hypothetical protein WCX31_02315 [Salinivirgaceae bacterium]